MGAVFKNRWIYARWDPMFIDREKPSIEFLELYALTAAVLVWGADPDLCDKRIAIFCDNTSVRDMVNDYVSSCVHCRKLLRIITLDCLRFNRHLFVDHVHSKLNSRADALSRLQFKKFWSISPESTLPVNDPMPETIWPDLVRRYH